MEDHQIVEMYIQRNQEAVIQTEMKYTQYCRSIAVHIQHNLEDANEALNDTWLAAWNSIPPHIPKCLKTFLGRLTRNISLKRVRSENALKRGNNEIKVIFEEVENWLQSDQDLEREVAEQELTEELNLFLDSVSDIERNVFVRRYWYMQSISEIAEYHGFSNSKVKSMLLRVRNKLKKRLEMENYL